MSAKRYADCMDGHFWMVEGDVFKCRYCSAVGDTCPECDGLLPDEADDPECERCGGSGIVATGTASGESGVLTIKDRTPEVGDVLISRDPGRKGQTFPVVGFSEGKPVVLRHTDGKLRETPIVPAMWELYTYQSRKDGGAVVSNPRL